MESSSGRKRRYEEVEEVHKVYKFRVLLPNGVTVVLTLNQSKDEMSVEKFIKLVRREYMRGLKESEDGSDETVKKKSKRKIDWMNQELYIQDDADDYKWRDKVCFERYEQNQCYLLRLNVEQANPVKKSKNDELTAAKTRGPLEFKVNGEDPATILGGEMDITNMHSFDEETITGTTAGAFRYDAGMVVAADCRGTSENTIKSNVKHKIKMVGTTRAVVMAGNAKVAKNIANILDRQLSDVEEGNGDLETVEQSSEYIREYFLPPRQKADVELLVAGWDSLQKEGSPVAWYSNNTFNHVVEEYKIIGCGRNYGYILVEDKKIASNTKYTYEMTKDEVVKIAEQAVLKGAINSWRTGGALDLWILEDGGEIIPQERQLMSDVALKYNVPIEDLRQHPRVVVPGV